MTRLRRTMRRKSHAPATDAERAWWADAKTPSRRRYIVIWVPWFTGMFIAEPALRDWHAFLHHAWIMDVPLGLLLGAFGLLNARQMTRREFETRLPGKRIRGAMLAEAAAERANGERQLP